MAVTYLDKLGNALNNASTNQERIDAMNALAYALRGDDPQRAMTLCYEAHALAEQEGYELGIYESIRTRGLVEMVAGRTEEGILLLDRAMHWFRNNNHPHGLASMLMSLGQRLHLEGKSKEARMQYAKAATLFERGKDFIGQAEAISFTGVSYARAGLYAKARKCFEQAVTIVDLPGIREYKWVHILNVALITNAAGDPVESLKLLLEVIRACERHKFRNALIRALINAGQICARLGDTQSAVDYFMRGNKLAEEVGLFAVRENALRGIGIILKDNREFGEALVYARKSLDVAQRTGNRYNEASALNNIGNIYYPQDQLREALGYYEKAKTIAAEVGAKDILNVTLENLGNVSRDMKRFPAALEYYRQSRSVSEEIGDTDGIASCYFNIGLLHSDRKDYSAAINAMKRALKIALPFDSPILIRKIHKELTALYRHRNQPGDAKLALKHLTIYATQTEEAFLRQRRKDMETMHLRLEVEKKDKEREVLRLQNENLQMEMQHKTEQLNTMAVHLAQKNELVLKLRDELKSGEGTKGLLNRLESNLSSEQDWATFESHLQRTHQGFIAGLARTYPSLSTSELKVCALLRTQLSTKEMANLLCVSPRAIEKLRYQIRKKIALPTEQDLPVYFATIALPNVSRES